MLSAVPGKPESWGCCSGFGAPRRALLHVPPACGKGSGNPRGGEAEDPPNSRDTRTPTANGTRTSVSLQPWPEPATSVLQETDSVPRDIRRGGSCTEG